MSRQPVQIHQARLVTILRPLLRQLEQFLDLANPKDELAVFLPNEDEIKSACECLLRLGMTVDARKLAQGWKHLHCWMVGPVLDGFLAKWAAHEPEQSQQLHSVFGGFPSVKELEASVHERDRRDNSAILVAHRLKDQVRALLASSDFPHEFRLVGEVWHIRYHGEQGSYPAQGNQCIAWLAKILRKPNRAMFIADLRGDPEGKLAADAALGTERQDDQEGLRRIRNDIEDIEEMIATTGSSDELEARKQELLAKLIGDPRKKTLETRLKRDHANIATQLRNFRQKMEASMPQLAAHLKATLKLEFPTFGYYPPAPPPDWQF